MTDNEIIKALEATASWVCDECKFHGEMCDGDKCEKVIAENALDLINRQKAEIERLQKNIDGLNIFTKNHIKVIRLQAIKEFAERLKRERLVDRGYEISHEGTIDNLVKEMTEVEE